jgi:hypothetical protein
MSTFDPDKYLADTGGFDPDAYLAEPDEPRPAPKTSGAESALAGAGQGITMGWGDEMAAGLGAGIDVTKAALGLRGDIDFKDAYQSYLPHMRELDAKARQDNPWTYGVSQVAGGVATALAPGMAALAPAKGAGLGVNVAKAATMGGVQGAGSSEASPLTSANQAGQFARDVGVGAGFGAAGQVVAQKVLPAAIDKARQLPDWLNDVAEKRAFKAVAGGIDKAYDEAMQKGSINKIGRELLDREAVTFGSRASEIGKEVSKIRKAAWNEIDDLFKQIDSTGAKIVSGESIGHKLLQYADDINMPGNEGVVSRMQDMAAKYIEMGDMTLSAAQKLKNNYKWSMGSPQGMTLGKDAINTVKQTIGGEMDDAISRFGQVADAAENQMAQTGSGPVQSVTMPGPGGSVLKEAQEVGADLAGQYGSLKKSYGNLADAEKYARILAKREAKNQTLGLKDSIFGAAGFATMGPKGIALGVANKIGREYGNAATAVTADKLSKVLSQTPELFGEYAQILTQAAQRGPAALTATNLVLQKDPGYIQKLNERGLIEEIGDVYAKGNQPEPQSVGKMLQETPEKLGVYATMMQKAAERGDNGVAVTHHMLWQKDPEYRKLFQPK